MRMTGATYFVSLQHAFGGSGHCLVLSGCKYLVDFV